MAVGLENSLSVYRCVGPLGEPGVHGAWRAWRGCPALGFMTSSRPVECTARRVPPSASRGAPPRAPRPALGAPGKPLRTLSPHSALRCALGYTKG